VSQRVVQHLSRDDVVARSDSIIASEIGNEVVALSIENGECYGFNRVASRIWNLLASPARIGDLCATLITEYKVEPGVCEREVLDLLEELRAEGMIANLETK
jgi:hypothetical protein